MKNLWSDHEANQYIEKYAELGIQEDIALRVYSSRLLGLEQRLVAHGGGNTSVKTTLPDFFGEPQKVLCVKGSGWDLATIEPEGLPALFIDPMHKVRGYKKMSDEDMVCLLRSLLLNPSSPNPSIETLLHAYLPHKFVDHTHTGAILSLTNQPNGEDICRDVFGEKVSVLPYVMPGFQLAKNTADVYESNTDVQGIVLYKHGLFTFGETAKQSYTRTIELVSMAEEHISKQPISVFVSQVMPPSVANIAQIAPIIRGACALKNNDNSIKRWVLEYRTSDVIRRYVDGKDLHSYGNRGVITPDHVIRTKNKPLILPVPQADHLDEFAGTIEQAIKEFGIAYDNYFSENNTDIENLKVQLDSMPRLILVPGIGLFGLGKNTKDAAIVADLAEVTIETVTNAERIGQYESLSERDIFDLEYWSLEQAKLGKNPERPLQRQVAVITGGGGTIGTATAQVFAENGAEVVVLDLDMEKAQSAADAIKISCGTSVLALACDVTNAKAVANAFDAIVEKFGGVDIVVSNAGAAWQGEIGTLDDAVMRKSFELNFFSHQYIAQNAVKIMKLQNTGGVLLFNASKQAVNPGPNLGAYGLPKAATLLLSRQYALEYGSMGIRSNALNADRIRSGLLTEEMIEQRSQARGLDPEDYLAGNLLKREVTARDVAIGFLHLALAEKTTADVSTVDGGNIAAALR